jgi:hypothetical protein
LGSGGCGNLYTPNPVEVSAQQAANLSCLLNSNNGNNNNNNNNNGNNNGGNDNSNNDGSSTTGQLRSSWSLRSFRSWLPWTNTSTQNQQTNNENRLNIDERFER